LNTSGNVSNSVKEQFDLSDQVAVVTGGAGFLGQRFAECIAELGGTPVIFDVDDAINNEAVNKINSNVEKDICQAESVDITDGDSVEAGVKRTADRLGRIDILINSAALTKSGMEGDGMVDDFFLPFEESRMDIWDLGMKVNLTGTMLACQSVGRVMLEQGRGSIINIASDISVVSPDHRIYEPDERDDYPGAGFNSPVFYSASKAGVVQLTRYLAAYWGTKGVRVNSVSPAGVYRDHDPGFVKKFSTILPMARMAQPQEFKGVIAFLASDASSFVTGTNIMVDGGHTCW
jgi:NAD(P)-dependent dehydrogenase (short-subunit alcohol dehydrogenase family)